MFPHHSVTASYVTEVDRRETLSAICQEGGAGRCVQEFETLPVITWSIEIKWVAVVGV